MTEALKLLQIELQLLTGAQIELAHIKSAITENPSGEGVTDAVHSLEATLARLGLLEQRKAELLERVGLPTLRDYIFTQSPRFERETTLNLFGKIQGLEETLKKDLATTRELLKRSKEFIDFHINVITETRASVTYAPPGGGNMGESRNVKMFDANV